MWFILDYVNVCDWVFVHGLYCWSAVVRWCLCPTSPVPPPVHFPAAVSSLARWRADASGSTRRELCTRLTFCLWNRVAAQIYRWSQTADTVLSHTGLVIFSFISQFDKVIICWVVFDDKMKLHFWCWGLIFNISAWPICFLLEQF